MPLTAKGEKILEAMRKQYGARAEQVFYASKNAGRISGVDDAEFISLDPETGESSHSVRRYDDDGRLHVAVTNISKANVCPYRGDEIPNAQELGLQPDRIYNLLREPRELAAAAATFNNLPVLSQHVPVSAAEHHPELVIGSTGTDAVFENPYLRNSLVVWAQEAIEGIETNEQRELSCSYRYTPVMTPGEYQGVKYDGIMTNISGNHVALVPRGRVGPDVLVADSALAQHRREFVMQTKGLSKQAMLATGALRVYLAPKLAADAKLDLSPIVVGVTSVKRQKKLITDRLTAATEGKLAADASLDDLGTVLAAFDEVEEEDEPKAKDRKRARDAEERDKDDDDRAEDEEDKEDEEDEKKEAKDKRAKDSKRAHDEPPMKPKTEEQRDETEERVSRKAMDAAIRAATAATERNITERFRAIHDAEHDVTPWFSTTGMAFDSADAVYRMALDSLGVDHDGVTDIKALRAMLRAQPKPGARQSERPFAMDTAATASGFVQRWPQAARIVT